MALVEPAVTALRGRMAGFLAPMVPMVARVAMVALAASEGLPLVHTDF